MRTVIIAIAGAIVGTAATLFFSRTFLSDPVPAAPGPVAVRDRQQHEGAREASPARRHAPAHAPRPKNQGEQDDSETAEHGADAPPFVEPSEAEQGKIDWDEQRSLIDLHGAETRDVSWARGMEKTLSDTLTDLAQTYGFRMSTIDCRSVTCTADVSWPSLSAAQSNISGVVEMLHLPCIKRITLPPECREDHACDATLVIDCTEDRTGPVTD